MSAFGRRRGASIFLCALLSASAAADDVAQRYEKYVDAVIPKTFEVARAQAFNQEFAVFTDRLSTLSTGIALASNGTEGLRYYATKLAPVQKGDACPRDREGAVDLRTLLDRHRQAAQVLNYADDVKRYVARVREVRAETEAACEESNRFDSYRVEQLDLVFLPPPYVAIKDNVKVGGSNNTAQNAVEFLTSGWQVVVNHQQNGAIRAAHRRLYAEMVSTAQYRSFARESCKKIVKDGQRAFDELERLAKEMLPVAEAVPTQAMVRLRTWLERCLERYETDYLAFLAAEAKARAGRVAVQQREDETRKRSLLAKSRLVELAGKLAAASCGDGEPFVWEIRRVAAQLSLVADDRTRTEFLPKVTQALRERRSRCDGSES